MFGLTVLVGGAAYLKFGWHRLESDPTPESVELLSELRPYAEHNSVLVGSDPLILELQDTESGGALLFFGSLHTSDPDDPQIDQIIQSWDEFKPTQAFCESRLGLYIGGLRAGVGMFGEAGVPYALARRDDIPVGTLEPSWQDEIAAVLQQHTVHEVAAFYFLRVFLPESQGAEVPQINRLASHLLRKRTALPGLENSFTDLSEFDAWWAENHAADLGPWRSLDGETLWPRDVPNNAMGAVATTSNRARDRHFAKLLIDRVTRGERVFVVCGRSHAASLQPVLESSLSTMTAE